MVEMTAEICEFVNPKKVDRIFVQVLKLSACSAYSGFVSYGHT